MPESPWRYFGSFRTVAQERLRGNPVSNSTGGRPRKRRRCFQRVIGAKRGQTVTETAAYWMLATRAYADRMVLLAGTGSPWAQYHAAAWVAHADWVDQVAPAERDRRIAAAETARDREIAEAEAEKNKTIAKAQAEHLRAVEGAEAAYERADAEADAVLHDFFGELSQGFAGDGTYLGIIDSLLARKPERDELGYSNYFHRVLGEYVIRPVVSDQILINATDGQLFYGTLVFSAAAVIAWKAPALAAGSFLVGAGLDIGMQVAGNYDSGRDLWDIDWRSVAFAGVEVVAFGGIGRGTWRVQFVAFSLDFGLSRVPISVPSQPGPNAPGLSGWIVTLLATPAAS